MITFRSELEATDKLATERWDRAQPLCSFLREMHARGCRYPSEVEMDALVKAGKVKYRRALRGFQQGAAEFARAACR